MLNAPTYNPEGKGLDRITRDLTAFSTFPALLMTPAMYRPSLYSKDGRGPRILANAFDVACMFSGDDRRAFRGRDADSAGTAVLGTLSWGNGISLGLRVGDRLFRWHRPGTSVGGRRGCWKESPDGRWLADLNRGAPATIRRADALDALPRALLLVQHYTP